MKHLLSFQNIVRRLQAGVLVSIKWKHTRQLCCQRKCLFLIHLSPQEQCPTLGHQASINRTHSRDVVLKKKWCRRRPIRTLSTIKNKNLSKKCSIFCMKILTGNCMSNCLEEYVMVIEGEKNFNTSEAPLIPTLIGCKYLTKRTGWSWLTSLLVMWPLTTK